MQRKGIDHDEVKPWQWATLPLRSDPVEIVSYPIPNEGEDDTIMVRLTVGDPTSIKEVPLKMVACFAPDRHEDFYRPKRYYSDNPTAFIFTDDTPAWEEQKGPWHPERYRKDAPTKIYHATAAQVLTQSDCTHRNADCRFNDKGRLEYFCTNCHAAIPDFWKRQRERLQSDDTHRNFNNELDALEPGGDA